MRWRRPSGDAAPTTGSMSAWIACRKRRSTPSPLSKRLGAFVGDGAVIDRQFGTTDVLIIMPVEKIDPRYFEHFGTPNEVKSRVAVDA